MIKKSLMIVLLGSLGLSSPARAEPATETPGVALTWQDCLRLAASHNPDLQSALHAMEASRAQYYGSYNGVLPHLALSNTYTNRHSSGGSAFVNGQSGTISSGSEQWQAQGTASMDLFDPNQWATIQSAGAALRQSQANLELSSATILLNLYKSFAFLLYAQEEIGVASRIQELWNSNAQMISLRYDSGNESKGNKMRTQAELLQAQAGLSQAHRDVLVAQQQLAQALGDEHYTTLAVTGTWTAPTAPTSPPDLDAIISRVPSVRVQQAVLEQTEAAVRAAHSALWPTASLNFTKGFQGGSEFPSDPFWTFTGVLNYPLFAGGPTAAYFSVSAANRNYARASQDLISVRNQARSTLQSAWSGLAQAEDQVRVQRAFLDSAMQRKQEGDVLYQSGRMTFQDWELITTDYVNFQRSFLSAQQTLIAAQGQWRFATGEQLGV